MSIYQEYIEIIVTGLVGLLVAFLTGWFAKHRKEFMTWLNARTSVQQRDILHRLAQEGTALVEAVLKEMDSKDKLQAAIKYVSNRLGDAGIKVSPESITAAIEKAVADIKAKGGGKSD